MNEKIEITEVITDERAHALASLVESPLRDLEKDGLPLLWHWLYLTRWPDQRDIGEDGHPTHNTLPTAPMPGQRRMWAGGTVTQRMPLRTGLPATKRSLVLKSDKKVGKSGALTFVTVGHTINQNGEICIEEEQYIVYRDAVSTPSSSSVESGSAGGRAADQLLSVPTDPTALFRFSALTKNAHRIHYDRQYARDIEGYPDLVVHGPLQAIAMAEAAHRSGGIVPASIEYRLVAPLLSADGLVTDATPQADDTWSVRAGSMSGRTTATGVVRAIGSRKD